MVVLRVILKGILKVYFRLIISSLMRSLEKFWVDTIFVLYILDTEYLVRFPFCVLQGLREEENE